MPKASDHLTIRAVRTVAVDVPTTFVLGTSAGEIRSAPLLLIDVETEEGITGRGYVFGIRPRGPRYMAEVLTDAAEVVKGEGLVPADIAALLAKRFRLIGNVGVVRMALSGLDGALWDAFAFAAGKPLATLLGSAPRKILAYNSNGLGLMGPEKTAEEALKLLEGGFKAVKLRLGYPTLKEDVAVTRAVRRALPDHVKLMTDYNQALDVVEATQRGLAIQPEGITWIEEPIRHDDYAGNAALTHALDVPIQIGENFNGPQAMAEALAADACDLVMPDLARIGGSPDGCRRRDWQRHAACRCRRTCSPKRARISWPRRRLRIGSNTWIGRARSCKSRSRSRMGTPSFPIARDAAWFGTRRRCRSIGSIDWSASQRACAVSAAPVNDSMKAIRSPRS